MKALMIGATGATGSDLLELLLEDGDVTSVEIFVRRGPGVVHPKLIVHIIDFEKPNEWVHLVKGDIFFSCLGTTLRDAGSKEAQWRVDYDYQLRFCEAAKANGVNCCVLVSSMNASPKSKFFYARMKGKLDEAVKGLEFPKLLIFMPPSLIRKDSDRAMERAGVKVIGFLNRLGLLKSLKPMPTDYLAMAILKAAKNAQSGTHIFDTNDIVVR